MWHAIRPEIVVSPLVGVDGDTEKTGVGVDHESSVSLVQVVDDGGFGEISHVGQIFQKFVLGRVLLLDLGIKSVSIELKICDLRFRP